MLADRPLSYARDMGGGTRDAGRALGDAVAQWQTKIGTGRAAPLATVLVRAIGLTKVNAMVKALSSDHRLLASCDGVASSTTCAHPVVQPLRPPDMELLVERYRETPALVEASNVGVLARQALARARVRWARATGRMPCATGRMPCASPDCSFVAGSGFELAEHEAAVERNVAAARAAPPGEADQADVETVRLHAARSDLIGRLQAKYAVWLAGHEDAGARLARLLGGEGDGSGRGGAAAEEGEEKEDNAVRAPAPSRGPFSVLTPRPSFTPRSTSP